MSAAAGVVGNTAPLCMAVCTGVGKRLHSLPSHPTLSAAAGMAVNTALVCMTVCIGVGKRLHALPPHPAVGFFSRGTSTDKGRLHSSSERSGIKTP